MLRELGRLREIAFRQVGEGTGKRRDIDGFDAYYRHVVLWDDAELQIVGAYRIGEARKLLQERGERALYTHGLFAYGDALRALLPEALELGRSFVQPRYQGLRALDYLWQGIGAYVATRPDVRYLFGPVSLSASYPEAARRLLVQYFARNHGADESYAAGRRPYPVPPSEGPADLRALKQALSELGVSVPVLYKQYADSASRAARGFSPSTSIARLRTASTGGAHRPAAPQGIEARALPRRRPGSARVAGRAPQVGLSHSATRAATQGPSSSARSWPALSWTSSGACQRRASASEQRQSTSASCRLARKSRGTRGGESGAR